MTWAKIKSQTLNRLSHPGTPLSFILKNEVVAHAVLEDKG